MFRSVWADYKIRFGQTLKNFERHAELIQSQFILLQSRQQSIDRSRIIDGINKLQSNLDQVQQSLKVQEDNRRTDQVRCIREWLAGSAASIYHEAAERARVDFGKTGSWIINSPEISQWLNDDLPPRSTVWMHGIPGAGG